MKTNNLYNTERAEKILDLIRSENSVSVNYLAEYFGVSGATIRTDLAKLENSGEIIRTHGGAMLKSSLHREQSMNERPNEDKKALIAQKALELIHDGDTLLLDTGTTIAALAHAITRSSLSNLRIFTNDIEAARILEEKEGTEIHLLGGKIRNGFHYCYGHQTIEELRRYNFQKLFLATSAISITHGLTTSNDELAHLKTAMIQSSKSIILLADSTKMNQIDFQTFAGIHEVDILVMDAEISPQNAQRLQEQIAKVILA